GLARRPQALRHVGVRPRQHEADARPDAEHLVLPGEAEVADLLAQALRHLARLLAAAALEEHRELVAAQPRHGVAAAEPALQERADALEHLVTGEVAAGVVDQLELVEVEVEDGVPQTLAGAARQSLPQ